MRQVGRAIRQPWRAFCACLGASLLVSGCGFPSVTVDQGSVRPECLQRIATDALTNPRTGNLPVQFAVPLGLIPSATHRGAPYRTRQANIQTPDGVMHFFGVANSDWTRAPTDRIVPAAQGPQNFFYVMDRQGNLQSAGQPNKEFESLRIDMDAVRSGAKSELELWRSAGPDDVWATSLESQP